MSSDELKEIIDLENDLSVPSLDPVHERSLLTLRFLNPQVLNWGDHRFPSFLPP